MARFDGSIDQEETQGAVHRHQLKTGTAGLQVRQEPDPRARIPKEQEAGVRRASMTGEGKRAPDPQGTSAHRAVPGML